MKTEVNLLKSARSGRLKANFDVSVQARHVAASTGFSYIQLENAPLSDDVLALTTTGRVRVVT